MMEADDDFTIQQLMYAHLKTEGGRWDEQMQSMVIRETEHWIVSVTPMIFNDRIVLTSRDEYPWSYTAGFCFDKGGSAVLAALVWDPEVDKYPQGYKKIACDARR